MSDRKLDVTVFQHQSPVPRPEEFAKAPLSRVIEMALEDLERASHDHNVKVKMDYDWHTSCKTPIMRRDICVMCFAGAVMHYSYGVADTIHYSSTGKLGCDNWKFSREETQRFNALDAIRKGSPFGAYMIMESEFPGIRQCGVYPQIIPYRQNPKKFKDDCRVVVRQLRAVGF